MNKPLSLAMTVAVRLGAAIAVLVVAGCASLSPPAPVETRPPPVEEPRVEPPPEPDRTPPRTPGTIRPDQRSEEQAEPAPSAAAGLVAQGWRQYNASNYEAAVSVAERAQRIEPRNPEVYLLMASAQFGLYRLDTAEQLARRGLSLSRSGTRVNGQLQGLLKRIVGAQ